MEQMKAMNALEPFLALSKSASSPRAAADLIARATSANNTFIFAELLARPQIQSLSSFPEHISHLTLLQIFSYGTYADYEHSSSPLPPLNDAQKLKLRQLSILTLAKDSQNLNYAALQQSLGLSSVQELEELVISCIYAGLITGTLDPYHQLVQVSSVAPLRDLPPNSIPCMLSTLQEWSTRCTSTLADLEKQIASIKAEALRRAKEDAEWEAHVNKIMDGNSPSNNDKTGPATRSGSGFSNALGAGMGRILGQGAAAKRGSGGLDDDDDMDLDEDSENDTGRTTRANKKRGGFGLGFGKS